MNAKRCKVLRAMAQGMTVGKPECEYARNNRGNIVLHPGCTRAMYKQLKKAER